MAVIRISREEMKAIVDVAEKMARRANKEFVVDLQRVEILENAPEEASLDQNLNTTGMVNFG
jgi:hypothetical protein